MVESVPTHVPPELVFDFDYFNEPRGRQCPHAEIAGRIHREAPDIFFTPRNGGHWVVTRYEEALDVSREHSKFSSDPELDVQRQGCLRFVPLEYDPPEHTALRSVLNPYFVPSAIQKISDDIRKLATDLVEGVYPNGGCEFITEIAQKYPIGIFMNLVDAPRGDAQMLLGLSKSHLRAPSHQDRLGARDVMGEYVKGLIRERQKTPGEDLLTKIVFAKMPSRPLTDDEIVGMAVTIFFAGLDTVASTLSFVMHFLGTHPDHYGQIREDPEIIEDALEEMVRAHTANNSWRSASHDFEYKNIRFTKGDRILLARPLIGMDDRITAHPTEVDFKRPSVTHLAFGAGPHRCIGSHLARAEMRILLEVWMKKIPEFRVVSSKMGGGRNWRFDEINFAWDVAH